MSNPFARPAAERYGFYGLGWNLNYDELGRVTLGHSGAFMLGAATTVLLVPTEQLGIVVLTNARPLGVAEAAARNFLDLTTYGKAQRDWAAFFQPHFDAMAEEGRSPIDYSKAPASSLPPLPNDAYVGLYQNDFYGNLEIAVKDSTLTMRLGPQEIGLFTDALSSRCVLL